MSHALAASLAIALATPGLAADQWVTYQGTQGPGLGKTIVLVSGDEEYRSEEALPQLGKILSTRHGFTCHVLFAVDPESGEINPDYRRNVPGLELLADADLMFIATRFRDLPDEQMAHIDRYVKSGKPIVALRTATHAFALETSPTYRRYSWNYDGADFEQGFGRQILGETWIAHHGQHGQESTRGVVAPGAERHPIVRGLTPDSVWGPTDVYRVRLPMSEGCTPIILGQVLNGMTQDASPVDGEKNAPLMPIAWIKTRVGSEARPARVFTSTLGAATDFAAEGSRRLIVNGVYWALGLENAIPPGGTTVDLVGRYDPTSYGFGGFQRGVWPPDHRWPPPSADTGTIQLTPGDRIVVAGNTFVERLAQSGTFDAVVHAAHPDHRLRIRHIPWSADAVGFRPREMSVPSMEDWVRRLDADVVILAFGLTESFGERAETFQADLASLIASLRRYGGADGRPPRLVLVSPIAHEQLGPPFGPPRADPAAVARHNEALALITTQIKDVAERESIPFVDLFAPSLAMYDKVDKPMTTNGIHATEVGSSFFAGVIAQQLGWYESTMTSEPQTTATEALRRLCCDAHDLFRLRYRPTNTEYVWGRRKTPYGVVNFPPEMTQLDRMIDARDEAIWAMAKPTPSEVLAAAAMIEPVWPRTPSDRTFPEDTWTPAPVEAKGTETSLGSTTIDEPDAFLASFTVPEGYVVECFASEQDFPELANPLAMAFDERHRLWVLCTPTYPHLLPGDQPHCKLIVLDDRDRDGHADHCTVFADGLYIPTGFAVDGDTVYIAEAPDLWRFVDTDGDAVADEKEIVYSGFGMCDSHHQLSAFEWDPTGALIMNEGVFTKTNIETPYGVRRTDGAAVWRLDLRTERLEVLAHCYFNNPWGHVFDDYGRSILADASDGNNFSFSHMALPFEYPKKPARAAAFLHRGRPTAGCELLSSRHFPDDVQESFLVNQSIGFHGTRWDRLAPAGSWWSTEALPDLLASSDTNFRPVAMETGPDGAIYIVDWCNPIVGHMQYSVRDPRRDHTHGRVWRVRHATRPLVDPPDIAGASVAELLELLRLPERNTRHHARRRLQRKDWRTLAPALGTWAAALHPSDPMYPRLVVEDMWQRQAHGRLDVEYLERALRLTDARARGAAVRSTRHLLQNEQIASSEAASLIALAVDDADMSVRLEGVVAAGFLPPRDGIVIAARADLAEMDEPFQAVFDEVIAYLGRGGDIVSTVLERIRLDRMPLAELMAAPLSDVSATVRLRRRDVPTAARYAALVHLAGEDPVSQATRLVASLDTARSRESVRAIGDMLLAMPTDVLADLGGLPRLADDDNPHRRSVAAAVVLKTEGHPGAMTPATLVEAVTLLAPGTAPPAALARLRAAVEANEVDSTPAVESLIHHAPADPLLAEWLVTQARAIAGRNLTNWTPAHARAMAAQRGLARLGVSAGMPDLHVDVAPPARLARGHELFLDEANGCARCHGMNGRGLEGFPALDRSPWILGNPQRAAGIVIHGLYGDVDLPDGSSYRSTMEPLGALLDDDALADILTYVRQSWGNYVDAVNAEDVAAARANAPPAGGMWESTAVLAAYPLDADILVPAPAERPSSGLAKVGRLFLVYLVPPLVALALILFLLDRASRRG